MSRKAWTKNDYVVADLRSYNWGIMGDDWLMGCLNCSHFPYAIWNLEGKTEYVHNLENHDHINEFDLVLVEI